MSDSLLTVAEDSEYLIRDVLFDEGAYRERLHTRNVSAERIGNLSIQLTDSGISAWAVGNYEPATRKNPTETIRISPRKLYVNQYTPSHVLWHETVHFIHNGQPGYRAIGELRRAAFLAGSVAGALLFGKEAYSAVQEAVDAPGFIESALSVSACGVAGVIGMTGGFLSMQGFDILNPDEIMAEREAKRQTKSDLPHLLQISYA